MTKTNQPVEAAGVVLYRRQTGGELEFLLLRNRERGEWGFPKGHRDPGDTDLLATAAREATEETGIPDLLVHTGFRYLMSYPVSARDGSGQRTKQVTYLLATTRFPAVVTLSNEHDQSRWAGPEEAYTLLEHDSLRSLLRAALDFLTLPTPDSHLL